MNTFEQQLRESLREQEQQLDAGTLRRLAANRQSALAAMPRPWRRFLTPAIGSALLATVVGVAVLMPRSTEAPSSAATGEQLVDNPEFYRDLDFYLWLAESDMGHRG
ncbi:MAG: hypothetical protein IPG20_08345 [Gammaproteobacteria bacterium]|jgi:hypothetical protein|nr:hypothetical protein [Gammaproteobacteria bacterium]